MGFAWARIVVGSLRRRRAVNSQRLPLTIPEARGFHFFALRLRSTETRCQFDSGHGVIRTVTREPSTLTFRSRLRALTECDGPNCCQVPARRCWPTPGLRPVADAVGEDRREARLLVGGQRRVVGGVGRAQLALGDQRGERLAGLLNGQAVRRVGGLAEAGVADLGRLVDALAADPAGVDGVGGLVGDHLLGERASEASASIASSQRPIVSSAASFIAFVLALPLARNITWLAEVPLRADEPGAGDEVLRYWWTLISSST